MRSDAGVLGTPPQLIEKRLVRVDGVNGGDECLGEHQRLPTCATAGVNDQVELGLRETAQDLQCVGVAAGPELSHAAEKELKGIGSSHASPEVSSTTILLILNHRDRIVLGK
ncbi:hypothetical protein AB395_00005108 (plasmid) [Sinorhizobium fredii CCBAU 45436]|nr:hypothetical protein AB395_00005108 [Sinorhizobium fredii CCBAU 45436]